MKFYFAPLESVGSCHYRKVFHQHFSGVDKYFSPFIVADQKKGFTVKDLQEILPENNKGMFMVPQILTNHAEDFLFTVNKIAHYGYREFNLNLGCPSSTVVSRNRGSGFLAFPEALDAFLETIFSKVTMPISIKTRAGKFQHDELYRLMEIYNKYPLKELIIHPRIQTDLYKFTPNLKVFADALKMSKNPVCYNGDIFTVGDYLSIREAFPQVDRVMLGRGLVSNPALIEMINGEAPLEKTRMKVMHDDVFKSYEAFLIEPQKILFKMKELWHYMSGVFENHELNTREIMRSQTLEGYGNAVLRLFDALEIAEDLGYHQRQ